MAEDRDPTDSGGSADQALLQELVRNGELYSHRAFILLLETVGGTIEFPFEKIIDRNELTDRTVYIQYDDDGKVLRYTVKHHEVITGELVAPENRDSE